MRLVRSFVASTYYTLLRALLLLSYEEAAEVREGNARTKTQRQFINDHGRPVIISVVNTGRAGARARACDQVRAAAIFSVRNREICRRSRVEYLHERWIINAVHIRGVRSPSLITRQHPQRYRTSYNCYNFRARGICRCVCAHAQLPDTLLDGTGKTIMLRITRNGAHGV